MPYLSHLVSQNIFFTISFDFFRKLRVVFSAFFLLLRIVCTTNTNGDMKENFSVILMVGFIEPAFNVNLNAIPPPPFSV